MKYAQKLLSYVDIDPEYEAGYASLHEKLDRIQTFFQNLEEVRPTRSMIKSVAFNLDQTTRPPSTRPPPLLPQIPVPKHVPSEIVVPEEPEEPEEPIPASLPSADNLLLSPSDIQPLPASIPVQKHSANSTALQEELSTQLSQMAIQLKLNALHFSNSIANDSAVVTALDEKLDKNYEDMKKERVRLRDHRGKSMGTTCLVVSSVVGVVAAFVVMVGIMRVT